jgi:putative flippase GtrA
MVLFEKLKHVFRPRSFTRYIFVGLTNTLAGIVIFAFLYALIGERWNINIILIINWVINNILGFILHKMVTFESSGSVYDQFWKFLVLSLLSLVTHAAVLNTMMHFSDLNPIIIVTGTNIAMAAIFMLINYFGMKKLIFRKGGVR